MKGIIPAIILAAVIPLRMAAGQHLPSHPMTPARATSPQDTTGIYGERKDSLEATVFTSRQDGNYLARGKELRTEVISSPEGLLEL